MKVLIGLLLTLAFCITVSAAEFTITIDEKYLPYVEQRAQEENMTVEQILESVAIGIANGVISQEYENKVIRKITIEQKLNALKTMKGKLK